MDSPVMMTFDYQVFLVQAYRGQTAVNRMTISAELIKRIDSDEIAHMLQIQAEEMDRAMLDYCGYVSQYRIWGGGNEMGIQRHSALNADRVYLLNGSRAGEHVRVSRASTAVRFPNPDL